MHKDFLAGALYAAKPAWELPIIIFEKGKDKNRKFSYLIETNRPE